ncbi:hypothetical protein Dimus_003027, partial [Dionaea muscipula]
MDRGTPYLYALLKSRKRRSRISRVVTENGHNATDDKGIGEEFIGYFQALLGVEWHPMEHAEDAV